MNPYFDLAAVGWFCSGIGKEREVIASLGCAVLLTFLILHIIHIENILNDREYHVN